MESKAAEDLTTRTANLRRQLLEKRQQREGTLSSRSTPAPPSAADTLVNSADKTAAPPLQTMPVAEQKYLHATESELNDFIAGISSAILANQRDLAHAQKPAAAVPAPAALEQQAVAPANVQLPLPQTPSFAAPQPLQSMPSPSIPEQARPASYRPQPTATATSEQHVAPAPRPPRHTQDTGRAPAGRSSNVAENGSPSSTAHASSALAGLPPSATTLVPRAGPFSTTALGIEAARPEGCSLSYLGASLRLSTEELNDVSDWLVHTNFYNAGYRQTFLSRRRRLAELEEERLKLLQEVEEESNQYGRRPYPVGGFMTVDSRVNSPAMGPPPARLFAGGTSPAMPPCVTPTLSVKNAFPSPPTHAQPATSTEAITSLTETSQHDERDKLRQDGEPSVKHSMKRTRQEAETPNAQGGKQERPSKIVRTEQAARELGGLRLEAKRLAKIPTPASAPAPAPAPAPGGVSAKGGSVPASRGPSDERVPEEPGKKANKKAQSRENNFNPPQGPSPRPVRKLRPRPDDDRIKDEEEELDRFEVPPRYITPKATNFFPTARADQLDLGHKGDTRFFMIKSVTDKNVNQAMRDGVWTTSERNGEVLKEAFRSCRNVLLFFSVNKSRAFQGYARMTAEPSADIPNPKWMGKIKWAISPPFKMEWLNTCTMSYQFAHSLKNMYNEDRPVSIGTDGQEIEDECGRGLVQAMERNRARGEGRHDPSPSYKSSFSYVPKGAGGAKKGGHAGDRSWSKPHYNDRDRQDHGYGRSYSPGYGADRR